MEKIILLEVRRQVTHLVCGMALTLLIFWGWLDVWTLGYLTLFSLLLVLYWRAYQGRKCVLQKLLALLERRENMEGLPGKGLFFFLLGAFLVVFFFPQKIALVSILILSIGDSLSHLYGRFLGTIKIPFYPKKNLEGHILGTLLGAFAGAIFLPFWPVLTAAAVAMICEIPCWRIGKWKLDDNLLIPLICGGVLWGWNFFFPFL